MNGIPRTFAFQKHRVLWRRKFQDQSAVFGIKEMTIVSTKATMESQQKQRWNRYKRIPSNEHRRPVAKNNRECQSQSHQKSQKLEAMPKNNSECRSQIHKNSRRSQSRCSRFKIIPIERTALVSVARVTKRKVADRT
jgi:hypothetical protein